MTQKFLLVKPIDSRCENCGRNPIEFTFSHDEKVYNFCESCTKKFAKEKNLKLKFFGKSADLPPENLKTNFGILIRSKKISARKFTENKPYIRNLNDLREKIK